MAQNRTWTITQSDVSRTFTISPGVGQTGPNNITTATSTDITGILKGDGANVSAAVDGTDYLTPASVDARIADAINFFEDYFFTATPDALGGIYYEMKDTNGGVSADLVSGTLAAGNDQALFNFINNAGLGVSQLEGGYYELHVHASKTGTKATTIYAEIYTRTTGGTETLIGTTEVSGQLTGSDAIYDLTTRISDTPINTTDKLVVKWYANVGSAGSDVAVTIKVDGNTNSRIHVPVTTEILAQKYQAILAEGSFVDGDKTKLDGIEAGADVTDAANVDAAGAVMESDLQSDIQTNPSAPLKGDGAGGINVSYLGLDTYILGGPLVPSGAPSWNMPNVSGVLANATNNDGEVGANGIDFAGSTDIGADLADADEVLVSDGGGNTTRVKSALSRFWTYIKAKIESVGLSSLNISGDLTVDTDTLHVDSANNRVGVGTATPAHELSLSGGSSIAWEPQSAQNITQEIYNDTADWLQIGTTIAGKAIAFGGGYAGGMRVTANGLTIGASNLISFDSNSGTWDGATIAGNQTFSGQVELTGQAASTDDSAMTRSLSDIRYSEGFPHWRDVPLRFIISSSSSGAGVTALRGNQVSGTLLYSPSILITSNATTQYGFLNLPPSYTTANFSNRYIANSGEKRLLSFTFKAGAGGSVSTLGDKAMAIGSGITGTDAWDTTTLFPSAQAGWAVQLATSSVSSNRFAARLTANQSASQVTSATSSETAIFSANDQSILKLVVVEEYLSSTSVRVTASLYQVGRSYISGTKTKSSALVWSDSVDVVTTGVGGNANYGGLQFLSSDDAVNASSTQFQPLSIQVLDLLH